MSPNRWSSLFAVPLGGCVFISDAEFNDRLDQDGDGHQSLQFGGDDCDDADASVFPGAAERCDDVDSDCDGTLEDGQDAPDWFADEDGDGFGRQGSAAVQACVAPIHHADNDEDCDDSNGAIHPAATEVCNDGPAVDEDCDASTEAEPESWYTDADGDAFGGAGSPVAVACAGPEGAVANNEDCDDEQEAVNPNATEVCSNGIDDDCDPDTVCSLEGEVAVSGAAVRIYEPRANGVLGRGLAVGDADGDGDLEFFFGQNDPESNTSGRVYVFSPSDTTAAINLGESGGVDLLTGDIEGYSESTEFGWTLAVGSISITGNQGLFVGAPNYESRETTYGCNGAVFAVDLEREEWRVTQADEVHYMVDSPGARMGEAFVLAEDFWETGETFLLLGTPGYQPGTPEVVRCGDLDGPVAGPGGLFLVESQGAQARSSGDEPQLYDAAQLARDGGVQVSSVSPGGGLGEEAELGSAVLVADLNGDGARELIGGAPGAVFEGQRSGAVVVVEAETGTEGRSVDVGDVDLTVFGAHEGGRLGAALAVQDLDGDGTKDLVMGAPGLSGSPGAVEVLFFDAAGLPTVVALGDGSAEQTTVVGSGALQLGRSVAVSEDLTRDGFVDLLAGGPGAVGAPGEVWGFSAVGPSVTLGREDADFVYSGDDDDDLFGGRIAAPGGLDADDADPDLLIAAPARSEGSLGNAGAVWWLPGVGI